MTWKQIINALIILTGEDEAITCIVCGTTLIGLEDCIVCQNEDDDNLSLDGFTKVLPD